MRVCIRQRSECSGNRTVQLFQNPIKLAVNEKVLVEDHPDRLASQHELAIAYRADGQVGKAVKLLEHVVAVKARVLRDGHPSRLVSQNPLTAIYKKLSSCGISAALYQLGHIAKEANQSA